MYLQYVISQTTRWWTANCACLAYISFKSSGIAVNMQICCRKVTDGGFWNAKLAGLQSVQAWVLQQSPPTGWHNWCQHLEILEDCLSADGSIAGGQGSSFVERRRVERKQGSGPSGCCFHQTYTMCIISVDIGFHPSAKLLNHMLAQRKNSYVLKFWVLVRQLSLSPLRAPHIHLCWRGGSRAKTMQRVLIEAEFESQINW